MNRPHHPVSFFLCTPPVAQSPCEPVLGPCQVGVARVPVAHFDRHVELAVRMLGVFVEIAGTEQMAAAGFHVISFHLPCRLSGSRGHEGKHTKTEKAYLLPASHIRLLLLLNRISEGPDLLW